MPSERLADDIDLQPTQERMLSRTLGHQMFWSRCLHGADRVRNKG